jgi:hypothetical protein
VGRSVILPCSRFELSSASLVGIFEAREKHYSLVHNVRFNDALLFGVSQSHEFFRRRSTRSLV